jgi:hypothetical protein
MQYFIFFKQVISLQSKENKLKMDLINEDIEPPNKASGKQEQVYIEAQNTEANGRQEQASRSEEKNKSMLSRLRSTRIRKISLRFLN